jgi:hypothetical protein
MTKSSVPLQGKRTPGSASQPRRRREVAKLAATVLPPAKKRGSEKASPVTDSPVRVAARRKSPSKNVEVVQVVIEQVAKPAKPHKPKLVRDSFTIPKDEYQVLAELKTRALSHERHVRKSELLRAGIQALQAMDDRAFLKAVAGVPTLKTGRPKSA